MPREETAFVSKSFRTPPRPSLTDSAKITGKYSDLLVPSATKPSPFDIKKVETPIRLIPVPISGKKVTTSATLNPN